MKRLAFPFLVLAAWGCDQDPPVESADLRRPSGLVEIPRDPETRPEWEGEAKRSDVLIVDTEAQGVRVVQYARTTDGAPAAAFVPAPVVYFPLVVSAPGYPTRIAANASGTLAYVIATADVGQDLDGVRVARSYLHIISVPGLSYEGRVSTTDHFLVDSIDITEPVPGRVFVPVDVVTVTMTTTTATTSSVDRIAIAYDELGSDSGRVQILEFPETKVAPTGPLEITPSDSRIYEVPGGVTELTVHGRFLYTTSSFADASNPGANLVTELDPGSGVVGALDAGGPTTHLVSAGPYGLLALRSDIPSVVVFEGERPTRSTAMFPSPYTPPIERARDPDLPGRIDLHDSPLGPAAFAPNVPLLQFDMTVATSANVPVVLVTHADGTGSFLYASGAEGGSFNLGEVTPSFITTVWSTGAGAVIDECPGALEGDPPARPPFSEEKPLDDPDCSDGVVQVPVPDNRRFRAQFRGALVRSRAGSVKPLPANSTIDWRLTDAGGIDFASRKVQIGDEVQLVGVFPEACGGTGQGEQTVVATVVAVDRETQEDMTQRSVLDLRVTSGPIPPAGCDTTVPAFFYEVYPAGDEGVLTQLTLGGIGAVIERVDAANGQMTFGEVPDEDGVLPPLKLVVSSTNTPTFECNPRTDGDICNSLLECAVGWTCVAPTTTTEVEGEEQTTTTAGLSRCTASVCTQDVCLAQAFNRGCPGVEMLVRGTVSADVDLRRDTQESGSSVPSSAPDDAISFDQGRFFMVSYPGARSIVEVRPGATLVVDQRR